MKLKVIIGCILAVAMLTVATPALALSIGASPIQVAIEVPGNGSTTTQVNIHYFIGDVNISLVDIPLRIEPSTIHVEAADHPVPVELTIYGDDSLGSQVYDGYIQFIAVSGGAATGGVQVIAKVTNTVDGIAPPAPVEPVTQESKLVAEELVLEVVPSPSVSILLPPSSSVLPIVSAPPSGPPAPPAPVAQPGNEWSVGFPMVTGVVGIVAVLVLTVLVLVFLLIRRSRH